MSSTGTEKHCRLCLMLSKGGTKACHHLLLKRVEELKPRNSQPKEWTLTTFLESKKQIIMKSELSKEKLKVLFPKTGDTVLSNWDLSLFCQVLTSYCDLTDLGLSDIKKLRKIRNKLCHMNDAEITNTEFKNKFEMIQVSIDRIMEKIGDKDLKLEVNTIIKDLESGPLSLDETLQEMRKFYLMDMDIREELHCVEERVLKRIEKLDEDISMKFDHQESSRLNLARNNVLIPGVDIYLDFRKISDEEEASIANVLEQLFEEVINEDDDFKSSIPPNSHVRLRGAVKETFQRFLSKGWRITSAKHECIRLRIECKTFKSLASLFREYTHGQIDKQLTDLNDALNECFDVRESSVQPIIYKDEFWNVLDESISSVEEFLRDHDTYSDDQNAYEQPLYKGRSRAFLLTARNIVANESQSFERNYNDELETCLHQLKANLALEFHAPHILIKASCSPRKAHECFDDSNKDDEIVKLKVHGKQHTIREVENHCSKKDRECDKDLKTILEKEGINAEEMSNKRKYDEIESTIEKDTERKGYNKDGNEIPKRVKKHNSNAKRRASTTTYKIKENEITANVGKEKYFHNNALQGTINSLNAIVIYIELATLTLCDSDTRHKLLAAMQDVKYKFYGDMFHMIENIAIKMEIPVQGVQYYMTDLIALIEGNSERTRRRIEQKIIHLKDTVQHIETNLQLKSTTEQTKNQKKAGFDHLQYLQHLCEDEECLFQEWQRDFEDNFPSYEEDKKQSEEAADVDIKYNRSKTQYSETQHAGDKEIKFSDLGKPSMLTQEERPTETHISHTNILVLKDYDESTQEALTKMLRPGPALLGESTDLNFEEQDVESYYNLLLSDPLFECDSNIVEDVKTFCSDLNLHREAKLVKDPKQGKKGQEQAKEIDREENSMLIVQDKEIWSASLQLRGESIALWCIQRIEVHLACMSVQIKRIQNSLSRLQTSLYHIIKTITTTFPKSLDCIEKEWFQVENLARHCQISNDLLERRRRLSTHCTDYEREDRLRSIVKELETHP